MSETSFDARLDALAAEYRRHLLLRLWEDNPRTIDEIRPRDAPRQTFATEMHHVHLPRLAAENFVDWDRDTGEITKGSAFEELVPLLELLDGAESLPNIEEY